MEILQSRQDNENPMQLGVKDSAVLRRVAELLSNEFKGLDPKNVKEFTKKVEGILDIRT